MSGCKCVFDTNALMPEVVEWLCANGAAKCNELAAAGKAATEAITKLNQHKTGEVVRHDNGAEVKPFWKVEMEKEDYLPDNQLVHDSIVTVDTALQALPSETIADETNFDQVVKFAKAQSEATRTNTAAQSIRGTIQQIVLGDNPNSHSMRSVGNIASDLEKQLNTLRDLQKEYEKISKKTSDQHKDRLDELSAKAQACKESAAGRGSEQATSTSFSKVAEAQGYDPDDTWSYDEWCKGGLTPEEKAELERLINTKGAGLSGAGKLGTVGAAIAASQEPTKRTFKEQCLLLSNIVHFVEYRDTHLYSKTGKRKPYMDHVGTSGSINANACVMADREPWGFMNQLTQDPSFETFFNIDGKFLSQLQPMIRLYKIRTDSEDKEKEVEITFDGAYNQAFDGVLRSSDKRGFGVGIKNFTFSYEGSDPFSVKKSIKARLSIFASSFDDLLKTRGEGYRYADLALKTGTKTEYAEFATGRCNEETESTNLEKLNFRLKAVVGWAIPQRLKGATDDDTRALLDSVRNSFVTLNLTPTIHEFEIGEDGRVVFSIDYLAYIDEFFDETAFNIFSDPEIHKNIFKRRQIMHSLNKQCTDESEEEIKKRQETMAEEIDSDKRTQLASIVSQLLNMKKVYFKAIPYESLREFNSQGPYWKFDLFEPTPAPDGKIKDVDASTSEAEKTKSEAERIASKDKETKKNAAVLSETKVSEVNIKEYISFFYLSDLVDIILHNIEATLDAGTSGYGAAPKAVQPPSRWNKALKAEKYRLSRLHNNFKQFRILLGPIELIDVKTREYYTANIGDLPISTAYFMDWLTDKTLKRDNVIYSLPIFLKDLVNNLIREFLAEDKCFDVNIKQRIRMFQSTISSYSNEDFDEITTRINKQKGKPPYDNSGKLNMRAVTGRSIPILNVMGERNSPINTRDFERTYNYAVFYAGRTQPQDKMSGVASSDAAAGIFHYILGKDKGIVKNIQLSKTDSPGLKEVRFEQEGYDGLQQLREVYDANITCYGAPNVVPGTYIYIEPKAFAPNAHTLGMNTGDLTKLGIGGYYMVIRSENTYGPGECETQITAKWVAQLGCGAEGGNRDSVGRRPTTAKCKA